jgi:hypothetical protein
MTHGGQEGLFESAAGALLFELLLGQDTRNIDKTAPLNSKRFVG